MALGKLQQSNLNQTYELTKKSETFKSLLSETETTMKKICQDFFQSIKQIYEMIDKENNSYINLLHQNPLESSYTDLKKLFSIVTGTKLNDYDDQKNSYMIELEQIKKIWNQEILVLIEKSKEGMKKIQSLKIKIESNQEEEEVYQLKEDICEILDYTRDIDIPIFEGIIDVLRKEKISDILAFLSKPFNFKEYESFIFKKEEISDVKKKIKKINNVMKNLSDHLFNKMYYSSDLFFKARQNLINKIAGNKNIIEFLKFLVQITTIDEKFIQSGSNGLNLLVQMKVDLSNKSFEDIKIQNTSLIGANFVRCNFSGSVFENVDLSGVNLNGALLLNCKWKNIKIHQQNKQDGHAGPVQSICFQPDGTTLASGSDDYSIGLWDVKTGQQKAKFVGHTNSILSVCFSPYGTILASGSWDNSIRLWDVKTGQQKTNLDDYTNSVLEGFYSPDGTALTSGSDNQTIGQQVIDKLDTNSVYSVYFSSNGTTKFLETQKWYDICSQRDSASHSQTNKIYLLFLGCVDTRSQPTSWINRITPFSITYEKLLHARSSIVSDHL